MSPEKSAIATTLTRLLPILEQGEEVSPSEEAALLKLGEKLEQEISIKIQAICDLIGPEMSPVHPSRIEFQRHIEQQANLRQNAIEQTRALLEKLRE